MMMRRMHGTPGDTARRGLLAATAVLGLLALSACQTTDEPAVADLASSGVSTGDAPVTQVAQADGAPALGPATPDPLEPINRAIYGVNWYVDHVLLRPVALAYRAGVPDPARQGVRNALRNLKAPVILLNDSLQGNWERAEITAMRFLINSTIGIVGLIDVADDMGYPYHDEDFGQTMAVHGVGSGPYLVLPVLGPSNLRDSAGLAVDWLADPFRAYAAAQNPSWHPEASYARTGLTAVDTREELLDPIEEIERSSIDTYAALRATYAQWRAAAIRNADLGGDRSNGHSVEGSAFDFEE